MINIPHTNLQRHTNMHIFDTDYMEWEWTPSASVSRISGKCCHDGGM